MYMTSRHCDEPKPSQPVIKRYPQDIHIEELRGGTISTTYTAIYSDSSRTSGGRGRGYSQVTRALT